MVSLLVGAGLKDAVSEERCPALRDNPGLTGAEACPDQYAALCFLTCLLAGLIQVGAAIANLGFLVSFMGHPVVSGFTSAAAIIIGLSQLKYIFGFPIPKSQLIQENI